MSEVAEAPPVEAPAPAAPSVPSRGEAPAPTPGQLDRLFGADTEKPTKPTEPSDADPGDEAKAEQEQTSEGPSKDDALDAVVNGLLKAGVPASVIKNASRADLVRWGEKQAKREADIQSAFQERADLKKKLDDLSKQTPAKTSEPSSGVPTEKADLSEVVKVWNEAVGLDMDKPLAALTDGIAAHVLRQIESKYAERLGNLDLAGAATQEMVLEGARAQLRERFPELDDDTKVGPVLEKMAILGKAGAYADAPTVRARIKGLMEDACALVFKSQPAEDGKKKAISSARNNGQPILRSSNAPPKQLSHEEVARRKFEAREGGATDEQVARIR